MVIYYMYIVERSKSQFSLQLRMYIEWIPNNTGFICYLFRLVYNIIVAVI